MGTGNAPQPLGVCPLISLTDPLKRIGDYPKCPGQKCAWWVDTKCALVTLVDLVGLHDSSEPLRQMIDHVRTIASALDPYSGSTSAIVSSLTTLGELGAFVQRNSPNLEAALSALVPILERMKDHGPT